MDKKFGWTRGAKGNPKFDILTSVSTVMDVFIIGCGAYMDKTYGCPGEWRCLKAAALGDGKFDQPSRVMGFIRCECPGSVLIPNIKMTLKLSEITPDKIYLSTCMLRKPGCPYFKPEEVARLIEEAFGIEVVLGTHEYS
jgi:predicted metal-binding protein